MADHQIIGKTAVVTLGPIARGRLGEVNVHVRGGSETFTAITRSETELRLGSLVLITDHYIPRTVLVEPY